MPLERSYQEPSEPHQGSSMPRITGVISLAASHSHTHELRLDRPEFSWNVVGQLEEETNKIPLKRTSGPRVLKNRSDRKYERKLNAGSKVSATMAEFNVLLPVAINQVPASLNVLPACFNQLQTSTDSLSEQPLVTVLDTAQPSGYPNFVRIVESPSTESTSAAVQTVQPSQQESSMPLVPVINRAHLSQLPACAKSLPTEPLIAVINSSANFVHVVPSHGSFVESAANVQPSHSSQQQNSHSLPPVINSASSNQLLPSTTSAPEQLFALVDATQAMGIPNFVEVVPPPCKSKPPEKQLSQTPEQLSSIHQQRLINLPVSNSNIATMPQDTARSLDVGKQRGTKAPLLQACIIEPPVQAAAGVHTSNQQRTAQRIRRANRLPTGNTMHEVSIPNSKEKSHLLAAPQNADVSVAQRFKKYPTQVWMRTEPNPLSSTRLGMHCNGSVHCTHKQSTAQRQPSEASISATCMHNEKETHTCTHHSWDRIIVSSDVVSTLTLEEIRRGIETFLVSTTSSQMVFNDQTLRLHWDGKDLGSFRYKNATTSTPLTIAEEIIISSSDDEQTEETFKTATQLTPVGTPRSATCVSPVTTETSKRATHDTRVTVVGSGKSVREDIKDPFEPCVIMAECISSDSEDSAGSDDLSDGEISTKSSDDDPTYSPDEEEISSEDNPALTGDSDSDGSFMQDDSPATENEKNSDSNALLTKDRSLMPPTQNNTSKLLGKNVKKGCKKQLGGSCGISATKKRKLRNRRSCTNVRKQDRWDGGADSAESEIEISDKSYSAKHRKSVKKSSQARQLQSCSAITLKTLPRHMVRMISEVSVPADIICPPCSVELFPVKENLLFDGKVNLSVIPEEELLAADNVVNSSDDSWACVANALHFMPGLDTSFP